jgi:hypothetical protein
MKTVAIAAALLAAAAGVAHADPPALPTTVVSLPLPSLSLGGGAVQAERYLDARRRFSVAASLGLRSGAQQDYDSYTLALGSEGRWYFWSKRPGKGPFAAARLDASRTSVSMAGRDLGSDWRVASSLLVGWRWILYRRVEISPSFGLVRYVDLPGGRLAASQSGTISFGLTIGWVLQ